MINNVEQLNKILRGNESPKVLVPSIRDYYIDNNGSVRRRFPKKKKSKKERE